MGAAQKLCFQLGCEVVETLVLVELVDLQGRKKLADVDHFTSLFQFSHNDLDNFSSEPNQA